MIISKLKGGLGNQMFQYAVGRSLAHINKTEIKIDISNYKNNESREFWNYELHNFNIIEKIALPNEIEIIANFTRYNRKDILGKILKKILCKNYIQENSFEFNPKLHNLKDHKYLDGYWQSELYFKNIESEIRSEFTIKNSLSKNNEELKNIILSQNSVSIHVRRGDYIKNKQANAVHGTCDLSYYYNAIFYIENIIKNPIFFIFSDDPDWAEKNIQTKHLKFIASMGCSDFAYQELYLMSLCRHNIIANSTFSWWGAWLNSNENKIVIAPKKWFRNNDKNIINLIPSDWITI